MRYSNFEWDDGNELHLAIRHGIEPEEAEELFALVPIVRKTRRGHFAAFGRTISGRLLVIVFERKPGRVIRVITGWDMSDSERRYYLRHKER